MRPGVALALVALIVIWLVASVGLAAAQGCEECREIKQELRGAIAATSVPTPSPDPKAAYWPLATGQPRPVVRAVLFWMSTCPHCHDVIEKVLPPLQAQYGTQLQIQLIELGENATDEQIGVFYKAAEALGIAHNQAGVPFLLIGDKGLMGSDQIRAELPGLIKQYLAAGGVDYPQIAGLAALLPAPRPAAEICAPSTPCVDVTPTPAALAQAAAAPPASAPHAAAPRSNGFTLALTVMAGMIGALVYTGVVIARGIGAGPVDPPASWQRWLVPLLALAGLGVAAYLAYVETRQVAAVCGPVGDCNAVQASPYARLFGVLPVGVLGVLGYVALLAAWLWSRFGRGRLAELAPLAMFAMALFGVLFSLYLTYLEPFVIRAVCAWCLTSAAIMTALLLLTVGPARRAWYRAST